MKHRQLFTVIILGVLAAIVLNGCGATSLQTVDPALTGTWVGECEIDLPVVFNPNSIPEGTERTRQLVPIELSISTNAVVEGSVGDSIIEGSEFKSNRGDLGRQLNLATDYIVTDGFLSGPIVTGADEAQVKEFTMPLNLVDGQLRGSLFWRQAWRYPYPICTSMNLDPN